MRITQAKSAQCGNLAPGRDRSCAVVNFEKLSLLISATSSFCVLGGLTRSVRASRCDVSSFVLLVRGSSSSSNSTLGSAAPGRSTAGGARQQTDRQRSARRPVVCLVGHTTGAWVALPRCWWMLRAAAAPRRRLDGLSCRRQTSAVLGEHSRSSRPGSCIMCDRQVYLAPLTRCRALPSPHPLEHTAATQPCTRRQQLRARL
jgi:hypothetical protein